VRSATTRSDGPATGAREEGSPARGPQPRRSGLAALSRVLNDRNVLGAIFMVPAASLLIVLLAYPLALGAWLGFTDTTIGRAGRFVGLDNFASLVRDSVFWLSVFNTFLYTLAASVLKFLLGLWLALLLNRNVPFKSLVRAIMLLPWIVPTVLSAIAFWWIYDSQFSIISWTLIRLGVIDHYIDFLGNPTNARLSLIAANVWRGIPFVAISLLAGLQTISPSLYEAATLDGASRFQQFRHVTFPLLTPIIAVVMTFSVLFTFTDFQLVYAITRGGPMNATHLMATLAFQRAIPGGQLAEGAAIAGAMIPFLLAAILFSYFGLQRRRWQQGGSDA
jgi:multiple sugar transport system permease protein